MNAKNFDRDLNTFVSVVSVVVAVAAAALVAELERKDEGTEDFVVGAKAVADVVNFFISSSLIFRLSKLERLPTSCQV